jgi:hypothetical protein
MKNTRNKLPIDRILAILKTLALQKIPLRKEKLKSYF